MIQVFEYSQHGVTQGNRFVLGNERSSVQRCRNSTPRRPACNSARVLVLFCKNPFLVSRVCSCTCGSRFRGRRLVRGDRTGDCADQRTWTPRKSPASPGHAGDSLLFLRLLRRAARRLSARAGNNRPLPKMPGMCDERSDSEPSRKRKTRTAATKMSALRFEPSLGTALHSIDPHPTQANEA